MSDVTDGQISWEAAELRGTEGGVWRVTTQGSYHILDLDRGTVKRVRGEGRARTVNDTTRRLRSLDRCKVGLPGYWTMYAADFMIDFYWHSSSTIRRIERWDESETRPSEDAEK